MLKFAVVILNWNGEALLERYLPYVVKFSGDADIYVADNASTDDSVAFVKANFPSVRIIQNTTNGGFSRGYNEALQHVRADVYCLLNSDVEVTKNWLGPIRKLMEENPETAIVQPKILDLLNKDKFEYAGAAGGFLDQLGYPFCRGRIFQELETDKGQYDDQTEIFWATGACMFIRAGVFHALSGFDEAYFAHQEEIDLCWRARNHGYKVFYTGFSSVYHLGGSTLSNMNPKKTYLNFRNSLYSITKSLPGKRVFLVLFLRLLLDLIAGLRFIFQGKTRHCIAIVKAHLSFYRNFRSMYRKRKNVTFTRNYYKTTSIVWSYFVNQVGSFNDLIKY
jgi:hypothetical protein